jgi:hypothetical protein
MLDRTMVLYSSVINNGEAADTRANRFPESMLTVAQKTGVGNLTGMTS